MQALLFKLLRPLFLSFFFLIYLHASVALPIDINTSINSEWTSDSNHSLYRSNSYVDYYTFTLSENTFVQIDLISSDVNTYLYLLDDNYQIIDENSDSGEGVNAKIIKYLKPGKYIIGANNPIDYALGNYNLRLTKAIMPTSANIILNSSVNGELTIFSDISLYSMNYSKNYTFTLSERKDIVISLGANYTKQLYLLDSNHSIIENVTEYGFESSKIVRTLEAGTYTIDVTSQYENEIGEFTLSLKENIIETNHIELESITDGEWTNLSGVSSRSKNYANYYTFTLRESKNVIIDLDASNSKELYLLDGTGSIIESELRNSYGHTKIIKTLEAGTYIIDVTSDYENTVGMFTLRLKENIITKTDIGVNSIVNGLWDISSGVSPFSKNYTNYYTFTLLERKDIVIILEGNSNYEQLYLLDENNVTIDAISSSGYKSMRIMKTLEAGTYTIDATNIDYGNNTLGEYTLEIKENIVSIREVEINSNTNGEWFKTSGISSRSNGYSNNYLFTLTEQKDIIITLESINNTSIYLLDDNGTIVKSVFGNPYNNVRLTKTLDAGTYMIDIASTGYSQIGKYTLSFKENIILNQEIELNSIVNGEWESSSGISPHSGRHTNYYTFTLDKAKDILIDLESNSDESLFLLDSNMSIIDSAWSQRIVKRLDAGIYTIDATLNSGLEFGMYTLIFKENIISNTDIIFNENTYGEWISTSGVSSRSERYVNYYTFTLANRKEITINVTSENDIEFYIQKEKGNVFDSAYSYYEHNATLTRIFEAGTYKVGVTTTYGNEIGNYLISINADIPIPIPVTQLSVAKVESYSSIITWAGNSEDTVGYKVYLNNKLVADIDASKNSYTLSGLNPESEYEYSVIAYNSAGESKAVSGSFTTKEDDYAWLIPVQYNILN